MEDILQVREEYRLQQWGQIVEYSGRFYTPIV